MFAKVVPLLQELIRNKCVNTGAPDSGQEIKSALSLKNFFSTYGIESQILESKPGRASLVARVAGTVPGAPSLMFMGHTDVVPAEQGSWSCDPFAADVRGGYVWGRGAVDMLNITASAAVGFADAVAERSRFPGDLIFLAVADEEASGRLGARWLIENHWDKIKTDFCVTEGGGFFIPGNHANGIAITVGEKGVVWIRLSAKGVSCHGSLPYRADNAAVKVAKAVSLLAGYRPARKMSREYLDLVSQLDIGGIPGLAMKNPLTVDRSLASLFKTNPGLAKHLHALSRMTISPNVVESGHKINVIPDRGIIEVDVRIVKGQNVESVHREIKRALGPLASEFTIEVLDFFPPNVSSCETPLYNASLELLGGAYPGFRPVPNIFSGVTDARFFRLKGASVYGFTLFDQDMTFTEYSRMLHGADERISVKSLECSYNYFASLPEVFSRLAHAG
jgi:acetylornithine deacetylase/succinyl-diaminopimelate desuccinylase-like protein